MTVRLTFIIGCTGSGKGALGRELAQRTGGEILSIDSMKVYRRMDVGTAKPSPEVRRLIPHHLIDIAEPSEEFSVAEYVKRAERAIAAMKSRGRPIFVVGGTALYIKALSEGLFEDPGEDPQVRRSLHHQARQEGMDTLYARLSVVDPIAARRIHRNDLRRIIRALEVFEITGKPISELQVQWDRQRKYECVFIGLRRLREDQSHRTNQRVLRLIEEGLEQEVRSLLAEPKPLSNTARKAVGYAEMIRYVQGELTLSQVIEQVKINTRHLAKSQRTWFKRFHDVEWIDVGPDDLAADVAKTLMDRRGSLWSA